MDDVPKKTALRNKDIIELMEAPPMEATDADELAAKLGPEDRRRVLMALMNRGPGHRDPTLARVPHSIRSRIIVGAGDGCWRWTGAQNSASRRGCARLSPTFDFVEGAALQIVVVRFIYERHNQTKLAPKDVIRMICGNNACVNPNHVKVERRGRWKKRAGWGARGTDAAKAAREQKRGTHG